MITFAATFKMKIGPTYIIKLKHVSVRVCISAHLYVFFFKKKLYYQVKLQTLCVCQSITLGTHNAG